MLLRQWKKEQKRKNYTFLTKKEEEIVAIMISADGKGKVFPVKLKQEGKSFE